MKETVLLENLAPRQQMQSLMQEHEYQHAHALTGFCPNPVSVLSTPLLRSASQRIPQVGKIAAPSRSADAP